ncbi:hypothetical protein [Actinomyces oricola]
MPWWNTPTKRLAPPVTPERVARVLAQWKVDHRITADGVDLLHRYPVRIGVGSQGPTAHLLIRGLYRLDAQGPAARLLREEVLRRSETLWFPAAWALQTARGTQVITSHWIPTAEGLSQEQLGDLLSKALSGLLRTLDDLGEELSLPAPPALADATAASAILDQLLPPVAGAGQS